MAPLAWALFHPLVAQMDVQVLPLLQVQIQGHLDAVRRRAMAARALVDAEAPVYRLLRLTRRRR